MSASIAFFLPANVPSDDTSVSGGAISANPLAGMYPGELMALGKYALTGGADVVWYESFFAKNVGSSSYMGAGPGAGPRLWLPASISPFETPGPVAFQSDNAADTQTATIYGFLSAGQSPETVTLQGTTEADGHLTWTDIWKIALSSPAVGNITVSVAGATICVIPGGMGGYSWTFASREYQLGLPSSINTSIESSNRLTAYSGITYVMPTDYVSALILPAPLAPGDAIQICLMWTGKAGLQGTARSQINPYLQGVT